MDHESIAWLVLSVLNLIVFGFMLGKLWGDW